jgi:hypothetical protein
MDRVRHLRLTVAAAVAVALAAAVGMSLVRSSGEGRMYPQRGRVVGRRAHFQVGGADTVGLCPLLTSCALRVVGSCLPQRGHGRHPGASV